MSKKQNVLAMIQQKYPGYHPLMSIAEIAHSTDPQIDWELRFQCHKTIAKYVEPELKSVTTINGDDRRRVTISMFGDNDIDDAEIVDPNNLSTSNFITVK